MPEDAHEYNSAMEREERWDEYLEREMEEEERQASQERWQNRKKRLQAISISAIAASLMGTFGAFLTLRSDEGRRDRSYQTTAATAVQQQQIAALTKRLADSEVAQAKLQSLLLSIEQNGGKQKNSGIRSENIPALDDLSKSNQDLKQRLAALETAIVQTPEKAISLPLLRQQLTDMQDKSKGDSDALHGEIGRLYGIMQWFLGLMVTLIIGVGTLAANSFRQSGEKRREKDPGQAGTQIPPTRPA